MDHHIGFKNAEAIIDQRLIYNAAFLNGQALYCRYDFTLAGRKIVDHKNIMSLWQPMFNQVGAQATRTARY